MDLRGTSQGTISRRQKRMGPAPFASFEDLSDEVRSRVETSPDEKNLAGSVVRLPGIKEDVGPTPTTPIRIDRTPSPTYAAGISLIGAVAISPCHQPSISPHLSRKTVKPLSAPRIDISRASSSSYHDSRDNTPERELFESRGAQCVKLGFGFKEDGTLDLRSSTEELGFHESEDTKAGRCRAQSLSPVNDESCANHRKDSQCSDIVLLNISGRTSRLSSIGSQCSTQSRLSNASHLSVLSGISRCSSPHKTMLETSFCGTKSPEHNKVVAKTGIKLEAEELEKVLLSRQHDPTEAILAEGIKVDAKLKKTPEKQIRKSEMPVQNASSSIEIKVDNTETITKSKEQTPNLPRKIIAESGVEYIYIPLKGPIPVDIATSSTPSCSNAKVREVKSTTYKSPHPSGKKAQPKPKASQPSTTPKKEVTNAKQKTLPIQKTERSFETEPKYIRIKLKPDHCYKDEDDVNVSEVISKPETLELDAIEKAPVQLDSYISKIKHISSTNVSINSPCLTRQRAECNIESITPSPSVSRRSSFASLFKSKEAIMSPESPTVSSHRRKNTLTNIIKDAGDHIRSRSRSRSKSRDRDRSTLSTAPSSTESIDIKSKHKSVLSLFKPNKKEKSNSEAEYSSQETLPSIEGIGKLEFKFNDSSNGDTKKRKNSYELPLDAESVRIPLHSPTYYEQRSISQDWKDSSQDSQETVIEAPTKRSVNVVVEPIPQNVNELEISTAATHSKVEPLTKKSTSSECAVFSTKLGSQEEVFTTTLPKQKTVTREIEDTKIIGEIQVPSVVETNCEIHNASPAASNGSTSIDVIIVTETSNQTPNNNHQHRLSENRSSTHSGYDDHNSSESERDSELDYGRTRKDLDLKLELDASEPERKAIFLQDSFEDELPYVPTTLPQERTTAIPIVPVKQRSTFEMKTYPIERPRSTTPINPSCLEEYCGDAIGTFDVEEVSKTIEKIKISLPRNDSCTKQKSPRKTPNTNWQDFADKNITTAPRVSTANTPPPLPPKGVQKSWINFEEIPEKRKPPKRIQTIPPRCHIDVPDSVLQDNVMYSYVNPEECQCECHELKAKERDRRKQEIVPVQEDELPLLEDDVQDDEKGLDADKRKIDVGISDCTSVISDSSVDLSISVEHTEAHANGVELTLRTPFTGDLGLSSNRSSIVSQEEVQSPGSPNAFPKLS